ncbi:rod shape-determining protein MreD [Spiribacter pallidus]|jgi:rod shape-determining protein MreD|uniref:Rod shape-determining protein MreD n=1 Tax=Spiribacter pallidus TaxID=1987936 RepID=A0ABV3TAE2_9GAMM
MNSARRQGLWIILVTIGLALVLSILPLPAGWQVWRPEWSALVLIYWALALPERVGVGVAWTVGLLQDVLQATPLGAHALAYAVAAYLTIQLYQRIRNVPIWQQALTVLVLMLLIRLILLVSRGLLAEPVNDWRFWLPAVTGTLIWPLVFAVLRFLRRYYRVS